MGSLHPFQLESIGIKKDIFIFSVQIEDLNFEQSISYKQFSKFPSSSRDLAFLVDKNISANRVEEVIKSAAGKFFKELKIFDVYEGPGVGEDKKSLALNIAWQSMSTTLQDSDIDNAVAKIVNSVKKELDGELRA